MEQRMANYVREHSFGSILKSTVSVYRKGFLTFFFTYSFPVLPILVVQQEAQLRELTVLFWFCFVAGTIVGVFAYGASVVSVSDICLGNKPSFVRSYSKVLGSASRRLFVSSLLQIAIVAVGLVFLVIPGLIFAIWLIFTTDVVVLEGLSASAAIKRSKLLGKGYNWRSAGLLATLSVVMAVIGGLLGASLGFLAAWLNMPMADFHRMLLLTMTALQTGVAVPISFVSCVLMYYDLRVRKEAYGAKLLSEELRN